MMCGPALFRLVVVWFCFGGIALERQSLTKLPIVLELTLQPMQAMGLGLPFLSFPSSWDVRPGHTLLEPLSFLGSWDTCTFPTIQQAHASEC